MSGEVKSAPKYTTCIKDTTVKPANIDGVDTRSDWMILVLGPTGSGKSRFIEALAGNDSLRISKDQLSSYTQTVQGYRLVNTKWWDGEGTKSFKIKPEQVRMYIIDTPGFSDGQISEMEIIEMVSEWLKANKRTVITFILYLCPITDTRLSGSKRRTIEMLKRLARIGTETGGSILVATTMWDKLWNDRGRKAAEERFLQLRDDIWKDLRKSNGDVVRFFNTHESAIEVVNTMTRLVENHRHKSCYSAFDLNHIGPLHSAPFAGHLYQDLLERIVNAQLLAQTLEDELDEPLAKKSEELSLILEKQLDVIDCLLEKLEKQLIDFGDPPPGFEAAAKLRLALIKKHSKYPASSNLLTNNRGYQPQSQHGVSALRRALNRGLNIIREKTIGRQ